MLKRLERLAGLLLLACSRVFLLTRTGLALVIAACGVLWLLWCLCSPPPQRIGTISRWLMLFLAIAIVATGCSRFQLPPAKA